MDLPKRNADAKYLSPDWAERVDDPTIWQRVTHLPDYCLLGRSTNNAAQTDGGLFANARGTNPFAAISNLCKQSPGEPCWTPKPSRSGLPDGSRPTKTRTLLFRDLDRLKQLLHNGWRPVQIVFAGKAHPADEPGRYFIHEVLSFCNDHKLGGHVAFL